MAHEWWPCLNRPGKCSHKSCGRAGGYVRDIPQRVPLVLLYVVDHMTDMMSRRGRWPCRVEIVGTEESMARLGTELHRFSGIRRVRDLPVSWPERPSNGIREALQVYLYDDSGPYDYSYYISPEALLDSVEVDGDAPSRPARVAT